MQVPTTQVLLNLFLLLQITTAFLSPLPLSLLFSKSQRSSHRQPNVSFQPLGAFEQDTFPNHSPIVDPAISFSHVQLFVDNLQPLTEYKKLERELNQYHSKDAVGHDNRPPNFPIKRSSAKGDSNHHDIVRQLMVGLGLRVTGYRLPQPDHGCSTYSVLLTSTDPQGVKFVVTSLTDTAEYPENGEQGQQNQCIHFSTESVRQFRRCHGNRPGIGVLGFKVDNIDSIRQRYQRLHPSLIHSYNEYTTAKVFQVYAYYNGNDNHPDQGTLLRFLEPVSNQGGYAETCILPGLTEIPASFSPVNQAMYSDHWVSNVFGRTRFLKTLHDTLGFVPKVEFNAGVISAGEAQIESTVLGNTSPLQTTSKQTALKDQSQVYLPTNQALSAAGHVHLFLQEIGQGIQHIATRVENLVQLVQHSNDMFKVSGEGLQFLEIPRSYYGVLTSESLAMHTGISLDRAWALINECKKCGILSGEGFLSLDMNRVVLETTLSEKLLGDDQDKVIEAILRSRYQNLYDMLGDRLSEDMYLGVVRNQILVDSQGEDILLQIFTNPILQCRPEEEAPFLEFIERVCSQKVSDGTSASTGSMRPGCGGFGIRNFLTLFLSIELSKAMKETSEADVTGDKERGYFAQQQLECLTCQLRDSNPIINDIARAMAEEGICQTKIEVFQKQGDHKSATAWKRKKEEATRSKELATSRLMKCSLDYEKQMKNLREAYESKSRISTAPSTHQKK